MTDLEKFLKLCEDFGLKPTQETTEPAFDGIRVDDDYIGAVEVKFLAESAPKVNGYNGFYSIWTFDREGKFLSMGAWE